MTKNRRISVAALAVGFAACLALRIVGILSFTDIKTGFLLHENAVMYCIIFYGICAVSAVLTAVFAKNSSEKTELTGAGAIVLGCITVLMAGFAAWDGILGLNSENPFLLRVISDFVGAAVIEILGIAVLIKKKIGGGIGFVYTVVGAYFILRGISCLAQKTLVLSVQEYLLEALGTTSGGVFLALFGKIYSGNSEKRSMFFMHLWGTATAVLTLSSSFGTIFAKIFGNNEISERITADFTLAERYFQSNALSADGNYLMTFTPYVDMLMGIFTAAAVVLSLREKNSNS